MTLHQHIIYCYFLPRIKQDSCVLIGNLLLMNVPMATSHPVMEQQVNILKTVCVSNRKRSCSCGSFMHDIYPAINPVTCFPYSTDWQQFFFLKTLFPLTGSKTSMRHRRCTASWEAWLDRLYRAARDGGLCADRRMWVLAPSQAVLMSSRHGVPKRSVIRSNCNNKWIHILILDLP